jgi:hypothetical protein
MIIYGYGFVVDLLIKYCKDVGNNIFFHSSIAIQPFVGSWPILQFRNIFYTGSRTSWKSDQPVARVPIIQFNSIQFNSIRVYLRANLTAQRRITELARIHRNTQK